MNFIYATKLINFLRYCSRNFYFFNFFLKHKMKTLSPKTQPIASARKSRIEPYLLTNRCFCNISVTPPYAIVIKNVKMKIIFRLCGSEWIFFRNPHSDRKARAAKSRLCIILSGPSHSQKVTTVGKHSPGSPISTMMSKAHSSPG